MPSHRCRGPWPRPAVASVLLGKDVDPFVRQEIEEEKEVADPAAECQRQPLAGLKLLRGLLVTLIEDTGVFLAEQHRPIGLRGPVDLVPERPRVDSAFSME